MDPKLNFYLLSKEDFASLCFYKSEVPSFLAVMLPKFLKSFVYLVLG
jgi:hypothetical protein